MLRLAAAVLLAMAAVAAPASPAAADHEAPDRAFTYQLRYKGTFSDDEKAVFRYVAGITYADLRGWSLGGSVRFDEVSSGGDFNLWLSEPEHMESFSTACSPDWSCRVGDDVIINEDNFDHGTDSWTKSLEEYRHMVINHETGHWLDDRLAGDNDLEHTDCPHDGALAPVMMQQSIDLQGCVANPWPVTEERVALSDGLDAELHFGFGRQAATEPDGARGYAVDAFGELHPFALGTADVPPPRQGPSFSFDIARDVAVLPNAGGAAGYVLDGYGGLHAFGGAPAARGYAYWHGWDIARAVVLLGDGTGGYVVDGFGGFHGFAVGDHPLPPSVQGSPYWEGWDIAEDVALLPNDSGGYLLDGWGGVHRFTVHGPTPPAASGGPYWEGWDIARGLEVLDADRGALVLDGFGGIHGVALAGDRPSAGTPHHWPGYDLARALDADRHQGAGQMHDVASNGHHFDLGG